ncbi:MAG: CYTH domain-containing protein [Proteobacteria bacterium]|nr:CYTH domain-containing protein [Pseudomonadota bacterium]
MELEIKLAAAAPLTEAEVLAAAEALGAVRSVTRARLQARYHDLPDGSLRSAGWTLRCRDEGGPIVATVKGPGPIVAGIRTRSEDEVEVERLAEPGDSLPDAVAAPLEAAGLPVTHWPEVRFGTDIQRCAITMEVDGAVAELAFDRGEVRAAGRSVPILEVEVELKSGDAEAMAPLARALAAKLPLRPSGRSKAAWGGFLRGELRDYRRPADSADRAELWEALCELEDRVRDPDGEAWREEHARVSTALGAEADPWEGLA